MLKWLLGVVVLVTTMGLVAAPAWADGGVVAVQCQQDSSPNCAVSAEDSGVLPAAQASVHPQAAAKGGVCRDAQGNVLPCTDPQFGWLGSDGCYWKVDTGYQPPASDTADQHPGQSGAWFDFTCAGTAGTGGGVVWLPTADPAPAPPPAPAVLAAQAVNRLALSGPAIVTSPPANRDQLVDVPTWLWLDAASWHPVAASAAVPGESVTATATPAAVSWSLGDGTTLTCDGPGTPYRPGIDSPYAASPTCGHIYAASSAKQPDGAYRLTATVTWGIRWAGGGQAGALPALTTTTTIPLRVAESQALNNQPSSG